MQPAPFDVVLVCNRTVSNLGSHSASGTSFRFRISSNSWGSCERAGRGNELGARPGLEGRVCLACEETVKVEGVRIQPAHKAGRSNSRGLVFESFRTLSKSSTLVPPAIFKRSIKLNAGTASQNGTCFKGQPNPGFHGVLEADSAVLLMDFPRLDMGLASHQPNSA